MVPSLLVGEMWEGLDSQTIIFLIALIWKWTKMTQLLVYSSKLEGAWGWDWIQGIMPHIFRKTSRPS